MTLVDHLRYAKELNKVVFIPALLPFSAQWSDLIEYRIKANNGREVRWDNPNLSITFEVEGSPLLKHLPCFGSLRNALYEVWGDKVWDEPATIMSDIVGEGSGIGMHPDPCPQIHWGCLGESLWTVEEDGEVKEYYMRPGDIIFLPTGIRHGVQSLIAPRAGIAYSIKN